MFLIFLLFFNCRGISCLDRELVQLKRGPLACYSRAGTSGTPPTKPNTEQDGCVRCFNSEVLLINGRWHILVSKNVSVQFKPVCGDQAATFYEFLARIRFPGLLYLERKSEMCVMVTFLLDIKVLPCVRQFKRDWPVNIAEPSRSRITSDCWIFLNVRNKLLWHWNNERFSWKSQRRPVFWPQLTSVAMKTTAPPNSRTLSWWTGNGTGGIYEGQKVQDVQQ